MSLSERRACSIVGADRNMIRYRSSRPADAVLRGRLRDLAIERRRFGYRRLFVLLRREGEPSGINRIYWLIARKASPSASGGLGAKRWGPVPRSWSRQAQRALVAGLRPRPVRQRPARPHPQHRRRGHQGMPGRHSGNVDLGTARSPRTDGNRRATRQARNDRVRPWHRVHLQRRARLVQGRSHRLALCRAGKSRYRTASSRVSTAGCAMSCSTRPCSSISMTPAPRSLPGSPTTISSAPLVAEIPHRRGLCRSPHRNPDQLRRSSVAPRAPLGVQNPRDSLTAANG